METATVDVTQLVTFSLDKEEYGLDISVVQEIVRPTEITRVPRSPRFVEGVVNLRGKIVPIVDLRKRFGLESQEPSRHTRIIIVTVGGSTVGLRVDGVNEVVRLAADSTDPTPEIAMSGVDASFLKGVGKIGDRLLILLDIDRILARDEAEELKSFRTSHDSPHEDEPQA